MSRLNPSSKEFWTCGQNNYMLEALGISFDGSDAWARINGASVVAQYKAHVAAEATKAAAAKTKKKTSSDSSE